MPAIGTRAEWGARRPRSAFQGIRLPSKRLWLHHTATDAWHGPDGVGDCQRYHMDTRGYLDIGYSYLVDVDGRVYEGRGAGILGAHTEGDNDESHAICCMGDFSKTRPPAVMLQAVADLVVHGHSEGWWPDQITGGHRDAPNANTACPGGFLHEQIPALNKAISAQLHHTTAPEDDMTDEEHAWLARIHHEVASGDTKASTVTQMLERLLKAVEALHEDLKQARGLTD